MALTEICYEHVVLGDAGTPRIAGTTKVVERALSYLASRASPEELHFNFPYPTLGQIYSALACYWDHQASVDEDICARLERVEELRESLPTPPAVMRLREHKQLDGARQT